MGVNKGLFTNGCKKSSKICTHCQSKNTQNRGTRRGIKRYFCKDCQASFSSSRRPNKLQFVIFKEYFLQRQTLKQLSLKYDKSIPWVMKQRDHCKCDFRWQERLI